MKSNVKLRSNVFVRNIEVDPRDDKSFGRQVRGREQVKRLVQSFEADPQNDRDVVNLVNQGLITESQRQTLNWMIACWKCNCFPFGQTFDDKVELRCKIEGCR